jgi:DNA primase
MAGRIPQTFIDDLVARSDIVDIIGARVALKKSGREYKACCPFHSEKTPSFWVSPDKQFYHCFGCGAHGTVVGFLMQYEKLGFPEAVEDLAVRAGLELPREAQSARDSGSGELYELNGAAARFFAQALQDSERALAYVQRRGIDAPTVQRFALGYAPDGWSTVLTRFGAGDEARRRLQTVGLIIERDTRGGERQAGWYDRFRDRLMFPIRDGRGRVLGFGGRVIDAGEPKYLNSPESALFHKGHELYGLYEARQTRADFKRLLIVEGYMDVVRLHQAGINYAVATLGTATTQEHLNKIFRLTSEVVFSFDGDRAGRAAAWRALETALPMARDGRQLKFLFLPEGHDPDSLIAEAGRAAFEAQVAAALPLSEYLLTHLRDQVDMQHLEGGAKLAALARPLFAKMPDGVYRELLTDRLAAEIHMAPHKLKALLLAGAAQRESVPAPEPNGSGHGQKMYSRTAVRAGRGNLLRQAIGLVLHHPAAARAVTDPAVLAVVDTPGVSVLQELIQQAAGMSAANTAMLLERWRDRREFARLAELASTDPLVADDQAAAAELVMAVEKLLEEHGPRRRMNDLLRKAQESGLNFEEKAELSLLLKSTGRPGSEPNRPSDYAKRPIRS